MSDTLAQEAKSVVCLQEYGLVLVGCDEEIPLEDSDSSTLVSDKAVQKPMLVSQQAAQLLEQAGEGSLGLIILSHLWL